MEVRFIRKGSRSCEEIRNHTPIKWYVGKKYPTDLLVNYGSTGKKLEAFYRKFPSARKIPTINKNIGASKYNMVCTASDNNIKVPKSKLSLSRTDKVSNYIEKKFRSIGGIGIRPARNKSRMTGKYYQERIFNRVFELRVHAFRWTKNWRVQKRLGDSDTIAWNFHNGGTFSNVRNPNRHRVFTDAISMSKKVLDTFDMGFGAVDFIVDNRYNVYFIEINSAPGFTEFSCDIYFEAFKKLCSINKKALGRMV